MRRFAVSPIWPCGTVITLYYFRPAVSAEPHHTTVPACTEVHAYIFMYTCVSKYGALAYGDILYIPFESKIYISNHSEQQKVFKTHRI